MSDGPHRSLPMKRAWRIVAERADNRAFGIDEICTAMIPALARDCRDEMSPEFTSRIRGLFERQETLLIKDDIALALEALRHGAGVGIGRRLIESVARISTDAVASVRTLVKALAAVLQERAARSSRQIEEHSLRKSTAPRASSVRARLEQATADAPFYALARQVLKLDNKRPARSSGKRGGLDEGPSIR
jgi:hypothetical protein